jgi:NTE family protein
MLGLVLEGGGARGAYEIGAVRAFFENGYKFDGVVGTSIGSINGAVIAQGDFEAALEIWENMSFETVFPEDAELLRLVSERDFEADDIPSAFRKITSIVKNRGLDTKYIKELLYKYVDEDKLRSSETEFGLVTYSLSDRKQLSLFKNDIPKGELENYLLASSMLPVFRNEKISGKYFADGGYVDVCPYNMLIDKGYDELVVIRVFGVGLTRRMKSKDVKIRMVIPSDTLGGMLDFSKESVSKSMKMGYFDALRVIKGYRGRKYYILPGCDDFYFTMLSGIKQKYLRAVASILGLPELPGKRLLFDGIIPCLAASLELPENFTYGEFLIAVLESAALSKGIDRYKVRSFEEFVREVKTGIYIDPDKKYSKIEFPYRNPAEESGTFRLPPFPLPTSYSYKLPNDKKLGRAIEVFITAISEDEVLSRDLYI